MSSCAWACSARWSSAFECYASDCTMSTRDPAGRTDVHCRHPRHTITFPTTGAPLHGPPNRILHNRRAAERVVEPHRSADFMRWSAPHEVGTIIRAGSLNAELLRDSRETGSRTAYAI